MSVSLDTFQGKRARVCARLQGKIFFSLLEGRVRLCCLEAGKEITIAVLEAGEMFGEAAFTFREGKGSYAQSISPSKVAFVTRSAFHRLLHRGPELGIRVVELLYHTVYATALACAYLDRNQTRQHRKSRTR